jgi:hypothetical protein
MLTPGAPAAALGPAAAAVAKPLTREEEAAAWAEVRQLLSALASVALSAGAVAAAAWWAAGTASTLYVRMPACAFRRTAAHSARPENHAGSARGAPRRRRRGMALRRQLDACVAGATARRGGARPAQQRRQGAPQRPGRCAQRTEGAVMQDVGLLRRCANLTYGSRSLALALFRKPSATSPLPRSLARGKA